MHSPHATWETSLVIPETAKPIDQQTLDALLRIEELLKDIIEGGIPRPTEVSDGSHPMAFTEPKPKQRKTK